MLAFRFHGDRHPRPLPTEPAALLGFRDKQLAGLADPMRKPATTELNISDEELVRSVSRK